MSSPRRIGQDLLKSSSISKNVKRFQKVTVNVVEFTPIKKLLPSLAPVFAGHTNSEFTYIQVRCTEIHPNCYDTILVNVAAYVIPGYAYVVYRSFII